MLKNIIFDYHETIKGFKIVDRDYEFAQNANYVLVGLRRSGKSTLLFRQIQQLVQQGIKWEQIIYINFEDERLSEFRASDFNDILKVQTELSDNEGWFFFDEIQNIDNWEKFARRMADSKKHVWITGSNAKMLSGEIETALGGRFLSKHIFPYTFKEYLRANRMETDSTSLFKSTTLGKIKHHFDDYFINGGFPETIEFANKREYISSVYNKVLLGDICRRNDVRNHNSLNIMIKKLAESIKDEMSFTKIHNIMKTIGFSISKDSVINYIFHAINAYLIFPVRNHFAKFAEKESTPKYYFSDNGIANLFLTDASTRLLENEVAIFLHEIYGDELYYVKSSKTNLDIDFYVPIRHTLIQVAYSLENTSNTREISELVRAAKSMSDISEFLIITYNEEKEITMNGITIKVMPIWKWMLNMQP